MGRERMKFGRKKLGVRCRHAKNHERAGVAEDGGAHLVAKLLGILVRERKMRCEFSRLRKQRGERIGAEGLKVVDVDEERRSILGRLVATRHGDELQVREQERTEQIGRLLPYLSLGEVCDKNAAICHRDGPLVIVDAVRHYAPPFSPSQIVAELSMLAKSYHCSKVIGDRYAGEFSAELFKKNGLTYEPSKQTKSELYKDLLPLLNSRKIVLPRNDRLFNQIISLERRVGFGGRETIDHPPGQHDDAVNAVAGSALQAFTYAGFNWDFVDGPTARRSRCCRPGGPGGVRC